MKKKLTRERFRYWFDCIMSKGPIAMVALLFGVMITVVGIIGLLAYLLGGEGSLLYQFWNSLMHTLDTGALAEDSTTNLPYVILMSLATLCGLFVTSILIGVITTAVEGKLSELRKGTSVVQESGHTLIVGFDDNIYSLLSELIEANSNHKNSCIVILGEQGKEEMEDAIAARIPDTKTTRIICRSGRLFEQHALKLCSVETCRSVIINTRNDTDAVKNLLALSAYVRNAELLHPDLHIVMSIQDNQYTEAAQIAGEGRARIIFTKDAIARIIANTCRQHGLSQVLTEFFNFGSNELYFERIPQLVGKTMKDATLSFSNAIVVGLFKDGQAYLNPPMDTVIGENDQVVLLEEDDGSFEFHAPKTVDTQWIVDSAAHSSRLKDHLIILGSNDKLPTILFEYNQYVAPQTQVIIMDNDFDPESLPDYDNLNISCHTGPIDRSLLLDLLKDGAKNVLLLNDDSNTPEASDSQTLLRLILLRDIADKTGCQFSITTEMYNVDNQRLATQARVDDFVIGTNFSSLLMAQISENPHLMRLIDELLDADGSELYMKPATDYVQAGKPVNAYVLTESAARKGEIFVGYRHMGKVKEDVVVNPKKNETIILGEGDQLVVIALE